MPGATELTVTAGDRTRILARATFGLVQSFDGGASWRWICEQAIDVSGETDPPLALAADGTLILLPPTGGSLLSRDDGCSWMPAPRPLQGRKAIDLTVDPGDSARVLIVTSTVDTIDAAGLVSYENVLVETRDSAATWVELATLPGDFRIETVEIAPSEPSRIYVSGTASENPLLGVIERSDDGGKAWTRTTIDLPQSSGSLFISAIDPGDPDRLWVRLPAQGDRFGLFPTRLLVSNDGGASFDMLAMTRMGMLGLTVSPDGAQLAYGGPGDGLFVGPADGSGAFTKVSALQVRCLRWTEDGLYACATEPRDRFSIGRSRDRGASFEPVYTMTQTCPQECASDSTFTRSCQAPWSAISRVAAVPADGCDLRWTDAGSEPTDAATPRDDAGEREREPEREDASPTSEGCGCATLGAREHGAATALALWATIGVLIALRWSIGKGFGPYVLVAPSYHDVGVGVEEAHGASRLPLGSDRVRRRGSRLQPE